MSTFLDKYLRIFNEGIRVVAWVWIAIGSLGALMSLAAGKDRLIGALVGVALVTAGAVLLRVLPITAKQLSVFGFEEKDR